MRCCVRTAAVRHGAGCGCERDARGRGDGGREGGAQQRGDHGFRRTLPNPDSRRRQDPSVFICRLSDAGAGRGSGAYTFGRGSATLFHGDRTGRRDGIFADHGQEGYRFGGNPDGRRIETQAADLGGCPDAGRAGRRFGDADDGTAGGQSTDSYPRHRQPFGKYGAAVGGRWGPDAERGSEYESEFQRTQGRRLRRYFHLRYRRGEPERYRVDRRAEGCRGCCDLRFPGGERRHRGDYQAGQGRQDEGQFLVECHGFVPAAAAAVADEYGRETGLGAGALGRIRG